MIVILNRDVKGTGKAGDVVKVSDGYARNMLLPKGYAKEATEGNIRSLEKQKAIAAEKKAEEKARAEEQAKKISTSHMPVATASETEKPKHSPKSFKNPTTIAQLAAQSTRYIKTTTIISSINLLLPVSLLPVVPCQSSF